MKKTLTLILSFIFIILAFCGCQGAEQNISNGKINIVTTAFVQYDFARQIAGDKANIKMLLSPSQESHGFEPTPQDIIAINESDLFIYTGLESDTWIKNILSSIDSDIKCVVFADCVNLREEEHSSGMEYSHNDSQEKDGETEYDEHVWTSPKNVALISEKIKEALCDINSENSEYYSSNLTDYKEKLNNLDSNFRSIVAGAKRKTLVFGDRFPLIYFTKEYGLEYYAAFPGCSEQTEASSSTIAFLIDKVREENIPVVLKIELSNDNIAKTVAAPSGAEVMTFYSCHNVSQQDFDNGETYLSLMTKNLEVLEKALN